MFKRLWLVLVVCLLCVIALNSCAPEPTSPDESNDNTQHMTETEDAVSNTETIDTDNVTETPHDLEHIAAVSAGCNEDGNIEYWHCLLCDKYFSDANADSEIILDNITVKALGHNMKKMLSGGNLETKCTQCGEVTASEVFMEFLEFEDVVYPYIDPVKDYMLAGAYADVSQFNYIQLKQAQDVTVYWSRAHTKTDNFYIEISTKEDFSNAKKIDLRDKATSQGLKFLLRDTTYYVKLTAEIGDSVGSITTQFTTTYLGPRFLDVGGECHNCRDLGGYRVNGKTVLYDMIIRGSTPDNSGTTHGDKLTNEGRDYLNNVVGIKTQIDFRSDSERDGRTESSFDNATYINIPLIAYEACFASSQANYYKQVFQILANEDNYPVYIHCYGGADRTGTVIALLEALLGVEKDEIIQDYVVTTFSAVCAASSQSPRDLASIMVILNGLDAYEGDTLSEKCESYLISIEVSKQEIFAIRAIMFGEDPNAYVAE